LRLASLCSWMPDAAILLTSRCSRLKSTSTCRWNLPIYTDVIHYKYARFRHLNLKWTKPNAICWYPVSTDLSFAISEADYNNRLISHFTMAYLHHHYW